MKHGQEKALMLLGGLLGIDRPHNREDNQCRWVSAVGGGREDKVRNPMAYYQEAILFFFCWRDEPWH